jgi:hypothetical protein
MLNVGAGTVVVKPYCSGRHFSGIETAESLFDIQYVVVRSIWEIRLAT